MPIESWTTQEETPDLAAHATAMIDAALVGKPLARDAYWAAVRKGYNTPYNDPPRKRPAAPAPEPVLEIALGAEPLPVIVAAVAAEARAA
ncbi:hypothetical protein Q8W71_22080 [Methylobacterium sp. NEAU 140]|uniref:hypothetical protein n=1 Tax=Methylobacterium sp. NEAU 140 TaxID=3064945 RepID=UPI0027364502|nr:hypothetical protein [Methylobacterium sp. NEAU 140]MDP4025324.1 hypothetical protein [Methylobacterium sp. NEAU 140]